MNFRSTSGTNTVASSPARLGLISFRRFFVIADPVSVGVAFYDWKTGKESALKRVVLTWQTPPPTPLIVGRR